MCGIAGIFDFSDNDINPEIANRIGASLEHRGPDYSEVQFIKNNVVFIHTRLAIIDLDQRSNFRCGFTEFIKKNCSPNDQAYVVDANPNNIEKLKKCYENFENVKVINLAITHESSREYKFFLLKMTLLITKFVL